MPLVRYEIPSEFRIANPIVYKDIPKHDAVALLESITMSALAGAVRQLGELSEFAAEIFGGLHEELSAFSKRERELFGRLQRLESALPEVEECSSSEIDQLKFAFAPGLDWNCKNQIDQNHFSQAHLPAFIQKSYEECSGPPTFYKLDKFEVAGPGTVLRRYTDPTYFRTQWAGCQLLKVEYARRVCRERKPKVQAVQSASKESLKASKFIHRVDSFKYPYDRPPPNPMQIRDNLQSKSSSQAPTLKISAAELEATSLLRKSRPDSDGVDSPDRFVDALATIEPETDQERLTEAWNLDAETAMDSPNPTSQVREEVVRTPPRVPETPTSTGSNSNSSPVSETTSEEAGAPMPSKLCPYSSTCSFSSPDSADSGCEESMSSGDHSVHQAFSAFDSPMSPVGKFDTFQSSIFQNMKSLSPASPTSSSPPERFNEKLPAPPPLPPSKWITARSPLRTSSKAVPAPPPLPSFGNGRPQRSHGEIVSDHRELLLDSITSHSMDKLRKVGLHTRARSRSLDSRDELLEQIRTGSFNLKHAVQEKYDLSSRPPADINVAAILEKASAIRHALEGSDEDEDWELDL